MSNIVPPCDCIELVDGKYIYDCYCSNRGDGEHASAWCVEANYKASADYDRATIEFLRKEATEAADEITRLRTDNERLRAALETISLMDKKHEHDLFSATQVARAALDAQPALSSWRPIDQPPIHPMRVLLFSPDQYDANWNGADYGIRVAYFANGHWRDQGTNHDACEFDTPTHWMPLPPAPGKEVK